MDDQRAIRRAQQIQDDLTLADSLYPVNAQKSADQPIERSGSSQDSLIVKNEGLAATAIDDQTNTAFITGGNGFLGRYVIRELLLTSNMDLHCLIRANVKKEAEGRLFDALDEINVPQGLIQKRVFVYAGDIELTSFGLNQTQYDTLAKSVTHVYHSAAKVNWVRSYSSLRKANVLGAFEVMRFACAVRTKAFVFVSSIAVCYASNVKGAVNEHTDLSKHVNSMPLGYAQTKCVAEYLLKKLSTRGLPLFIIRPALIGGDSQTGFSSSTDLTAAVIDGCVSSGLAGDADWPMDHVAVDYAANVIARMPFSSNWSTHLVSDTLHLRHNRARQWRELVLMLNLYGYKIKFTSMKKWLDSVPGNQDRCGSRLYAYRHFFLQKQTNNGERYIHELYLKPDQLKIVSEHSERWLEANKLSAPPNDALALRNGIGYWRQQKILPDLANRSNKIEAVESTVAELHKLFKPLLQQSNEEILDIVPIPLHIDESIFSELATISTEHSAGLTAWRALLKDHESEQPKAFDCVVKTRGNDHTLIDTCIEVATLCGNTLGKLVHEYQHSLNLANGTTREEALYSSGIPALKQHTPRYLGAWVDGIKQSSSLVLEKIAEIKPHTGQPWDFDDITCVLDGLANIQSIPVDTLNNGKIGKTLEPARSVELTMEMEALWSELIRFSAPFTNQWENSLAEQQLELIHSMRDWLTTEHNQLQVLVHNDFNPRNLLIRQFNGKRQLCAYDWELAVIGSPHIDLVEFLVFTLDTESLSETKLSNIVQEQQHRLESRLDSSLDQQKWRSGFTIALRIFMITRLPWYCLIHRFSPQPHLALCCKNACRMNELTSKWLAIYEVS